jgi:hypothetical protein
MSQRPRGAPTGQHITCRSYRKEEKKLAAQDLKDLFKFRTHLLDYLLTLGDVRLGIITSQTLARATNGKALVIQQAPDLADNQHVLTLVIAAIAAAFNGL